MPCHFSGGTLFHGHFLAPKMSSPQAISTLHTPCTLVRHSGLAPSSKAPPKLFPRFTSHPRSSGTRVSLLPAKLPQSYFHTASHPRSSGNPGLTASSAALPKLFPRILPFHARPAFPSRSFQRSSCLALSSGAPLKLFPHFTPHPRSSGTPVSPPSGALPKLFPSFTSHPRSFSFRSFQRSSPLLFTRFTPHPRSSTPVSLLPAELPSHYFHASHPIHARPALRSRSFQRSCPQATSTFHSRPALRSRSSSEAPFPCFTSHPRSSGTPVSLLPAELPPSHSHASHPIHIRPALPSRSFQRSSPQASSTLHIPSTLVRHFPKLFLRFTSHPQSSGALRSRWAPPKLFPRLTSHPRSSGSPQAISTLSSLLPSFLSSLLPSFLPPLLLRLFCLAPFAGK